MAQEGGGFSRRNMKLPPEVNRVLYVLRIFIQNFGDLSNFFSEIDILVILGFTISNFVST